jgi:hypothetical protein
MQDPAARAHFAAAGRERMLINHNWNASMKRLDAIVERVLAAYEDEHFTN